MHVRLTYHQCMPTDPAGRRGLRFRLPLSSCSSHLHSEEKLQVIGISQHIFTGRGGIFCFKRFHQRAVTTTMARFLALERLTLATLKIGSELNLGTARTTFDISSVNIPEMAKLCPSRIRMVVSVDRL